jgi:hypothetical protein
MAVPHIEGKWKKGLKCFQLTSTPLTALKRRAKLSSIIGAQRSVFYQAAQANTLVSDSQAALGPVSRPQGTPKWPGGGLRPAFRLRLRPCIPVSVSLSITYNATIWVFPKGPSAVGSVTAYGAAGRWWNLQEVGPVRRKVGHWDTSLKRILEPRPLPVALRFLAAMRWAVFPTMPSHHGALPCHRPKIKGPTKYGPKPAKLWVKINLSSFKVDYLSSFATIIESGLAHMGSVFLICKVRFLH